MLIDAFTYNGEKDMLDFRMRLLEPYVDRFVAVECDHTFSGKPKPFYLSGGAIENPKLLAYRFHFDPSHLNLRDRPQAYQPTHDCWQIEYAQRNAIAAACSHYADKDVLLIGDVDEIPSRESLELLKTQEFPGIATFNMYFFYYNLHCLRDEVWSGTIWCPRKALREFSPQQLRDARGHTGFSVERAGWHLSYFTDAAGIKNKIESFSHQEHNIPEFTDTQRIEARVAAGADLFDRPVASSAPDERFFPDYFRENVSKEWW